MSFLEFVVILGAAGLSACLAIAWFARLQRQPPQARFPSQEPVSFLFDRDILRHSSESAQRLHSLHSGRDTWENLHRLLVDRFPDFPATMHDAIGTVSFEAAMQGDGGTVRLMQNGSFTEVEIKEMDPRPASELSAESIVENLQRASDTTPHPVWQLAADGQVIWHNKAYDTLFRKLHGAAPTPDRMVFASIDDDCGPHGRKRVSAQTEISGKKNWYEVSAVTAGKITVFHAVDVNAVVSSEIAQRNFVQTLAKTFAQLSSGLAIFDRHQQLALFNPALIDLTNLPADFLTARPTLISFFDRLRENRRMPEPKNYRSWRQQIADVIAAATDGRYQETWTLESGQTFRVRGRPHPDGAIAFLIEDISAEVSLTRNFRAELELGQSLMDTFDDALAVFSSTGVLSFCNKSYRTLWRLDPDNSFADVTLADSVAAWKGLCKPGARWAAMADVIMDYKQRDHWDMQAKMLSGERVLCRVSRIASGATVVRFSITCNAQMVPSVQTKVGLAT